MECKYALQCHNERDGISNNQTQNCLLNLYSGTDQRIHQYSASLAFVRLVNSPHKGPVTRKMFPFDDVIMNFLFHLKKPERLTSLHDLCRRTSNCFNNLHKDPKWTAYKFSSFFNLIAWHQIYHFIIKVKRVKIGNILSEVFKQWKSQAIIQFTWEKMVFFFDDIIITKYTETKFQRDGIEPARFNTKRENLRSKFYQCWSMGPIDNTFNIGFC